MGLGEDMLRDGYVDIEVHGLGVQRIYRQHVIVEIRPAQGWVIDKHVTYKNGMQVWVMHR